METTIEYSFMDSFRHWWGKNRLEQSEHDVLSTLPFYPESDGIRVAKVLNVPIGDNQYIHEFNVKNVVLTEQERHVVLVHGYGAALGLFYNNFDGLTQRSNVNLHALDMLGYGLSSRPKLPKFKGNSLEDVKKVEDFFLDSMEKWRQEKNIEKFHLIGHSFGGYLSALYTLRYPERVDKLVLVSPVGVERSIFDLSVPESERTKTKLEGPDIEREVGAHHHRTDEPVKTSSSVHVPDEDGYVSRVPNLPRMVTYIWEHNISPFSFIRALGPWGPNITKKWSFRRFGENDPDMTMKLHIYCYNTFVAKASGEYALTRILGPGALARHPLLNRIPKQISSESLWLYGDVDWMSKEAGKTITDEINREGNVKADYDIITGAGHHLYLDNTVAFNNRVYDFFGW
jgi:cardiolipin-specific phospholipase